MELLLPSLDRDAGRPLYDQLYGALRDAILDKRLRPGVKMPSTRDLCEQLAISRNTALEAFARLRVEGYVEARVGSGTYVTRDIPDGLLRARSVSTPERAAATSAAISARGKLIVESEPVPTRSWSRLLPFYPGIPSFELLPLGVWRRLVDRHLTPAAAARLFHYGGPEGLLQLREAIAAYLVTSRGVTCTPDQVIVVAGSQQAVDLTARVLLDPGDAVWMEDPGWHGARSAFLAAGATVVPVPIDHDGLDLEAARQREPAARLAHVTPSHQFPLGRTMGLVRRLELLDWAASSGAWILEDDYDSEFRYAGAPLPALQGLDTAGRVIYTGTFSKVLFPALRLGYLVVPDALVEPFRAAHALADRHNPSVDQAVLAAFLTEGHFTRHLRRIRAAYGERQELMLEQLRDRLPDILEVSPDPAGMHLVAWLPPGVDDVAMADASAAAGISAPPLSYYSIEPPRRGALMLGYTGASRPRIKVGIQQLAAALRSALGR
jgi:GntR family transcriptional regulator / MocR family aminotransferase